MLPTLGVTELSIIGGIVFFLFGGKKLGELGTGVGEFIKGLKGASREALPEGESHDS